MTKRTIALFSILSIFASVLFTQNVSRKIQGLKKTANDMEDAFGILDKGELINAIGNQGNISNSYYKLVIYNFRWPKSKGVATLSSAANAVNGCSMVFGSKGNVVEGFSSLNRNEDFQGVIGSRGHYFADDQPKSLSAPDGAPRLAHSDLPLTWPAGFMDTVGVWHPSPTGDTTVLSSADKNLVLSKGAWYDKDKNFWRFWPGRFRIDIDSTSPTYRKEIPGQFAADREVLAMECDRNAQLPDTVMGIQYKLQAYSYGRRFAQDIQFYDIIITNTSASRLDSCWFGYHIDMRFSDANEEAYGAYKLGPNPNGYNNVIYNFDYNGTTTAERGVGYFGCALLGTPKNLGVTDGHLYRGTSAYYPSKAARNIWRVMTSDTTNFPLLPNPRTDYFHGPNVKFDDFNDDALIAAMQRNAAFLVSSGPFSMNPGESVRATIAFMAGSTLDQFKNTANKALELFLAEFNGASAPPSPIVTGVAGDRRNILYWTDTPEKVPDVLSKKIDFQGYKIYRSQDKGSTWGQPITDTKGNTVGYVPIAQFDKIDLIQGVDPLNSFNDLGSNTGLVHMFIDTLVQNGIEYSYTVTSYDGGDAANNLESLESARGTTAADQNLVDLTPRSDAAEYLPATHSINHVNGLGKGPIKITVADPTLLSTQLYRIVFNSNVPTDGFYLLNQAGARVDSVPFGSNAMSVTNGFQMSITNDAQSIGVHSVVDETGSSVLGPSNKNKAFRWFVNVLDSTAISSNYNAVKSDYEVRFTSNGSYADSARPDNQMMYASYKVPYEVWNISGTQPVQVNSILLDTNKNNKLDHGEGIIIVNTPYANPMSSSDTLGLLKKANQVRYVLHVDYSPADVSLGAQLPEQGEMFRVTTYSQYSRTDTLQLQFKLSSLSSDKQLIQQGLSKVRVVPNPYFGYANWELVKNTRKLRFMFLPSTCTISIYTVRGELVTRLHHTNGTGDEDWNLTNTSGVEVAYGVYLYAIQTTSGEKAIGKFSIVK